jgi:hypothetical protein
MPIFYLGIWNSSFREFQFHNPTRRRYSNIRLCAQCPIWNHQVGRGFSLRNLKDRIDIFYFYRLCFAASREGQMLEVFSYVSVKNLTPAPAVVLQVRYYTKNN